MEAGIKEGTEVYGILLDADGHFVSRGTVTAAGEDGFTVKYREVPCVRYMYSDIGSTVCMSKEDALRMAEDACEGKRRAEREDFAELNSRPLGKMP